MDLTQVDEARAKEKADFATAEAELTDGIDILGRATGFLKREVAKNPFVFAQIDTANMQSLTQVVGTVIVAAASTGSERRQLLAMVQQSSKDEDSDTGASAASSHKNKSGGIVDLLENMKEKAEGELRALREVERNAKQEYAMLKSLCRQTGADTKDLEDQKPGKAAAEDEQAASKARQRSRSPRLDALERIAGELAIDESMAEAEGAEVASTTPEATASDIQRILGESRLRTALEVLTAARDSELRWRPSTVHESLLLASRETGCGAQSEDFEREIAAIRLSSATEDVKTARLVAVFERAREALARSIFDILHDKEVY